MPRLFTLLCLTLFTLTMPACDEGPNDTSASTSESSTGDDGSSGDSSSTDKPDDLAPGGGTDTTDATTGTDEHPGTATLATPHINTDHPTH